MAGERDYNSDEPASTWAQSADVGDEWNNETSQITRIK